MEDSAATPSSSPVTERIHLYSLNGNPPIECPASPFLIGQKIYTKERGIFLGWVAEADGEAFGVVGEVTQYYYYARLNTNDFIDTNQILSGEISWGKYYPRHFPNFKRTKDTYPHEQQ